MRHIISRVSAVKVRFRKALRCLPRSATVHAIAAARHLVQGNHLEALTSICLAIASFRHR